MLRGFTLLEIIAVLPLMVLVGAIVAGVFPVLVRDVPRVQETVNVRVRLGHMLGRLQKDVDAAGSLPESAAGRSAGEGLLLLQLPDAVVCYEVGRGSVTRSRLSEDANGQPIETDAWSVPSARVSFNRWPRSGRCRAVEVHTAVEHTMHGQTREKLAKTHLFHLAVLPGRRAQE